MPKLIPTYPGINFKKIMSRQYFKYSPGKGASLWEEHYREGRIRLNFSEYNNSLGDLRQYNSMEEINIATGKDESSYSNETWNMWLFREANIGDVVIANRGVSEVIGFGVIDGFYQFDEKRNDFAHWREVRWIANASWKYQRGQFPPLKNLFRPDTFAPTLPYKKIVNEYLSAYPQYRDVFEQEGIGSDELPTLSKFRLSTKRIEGYTLKEFSRSFTGREIDFEQLAKDKKVIGDAGERLVIEMERARLMKLKRPDLASKVEKVLDGRGFDVISFEADETERYIEVKSTTGNENEPFYMSANERAFFDRDGDQYFIYRVFSLDTGNGRGEVIVVPAKELRERLEFQAILFKVALKPFDK